MGFFIGFPWVPIGISHTIYTKERDMVWILFGFYLDSNWIPIGISYVYIVQTGKKQAEFLEKNFCLGLQIKFKHGKQR